MKSFAFFLVLSLSLFAELCGISLKKDGEMLYVDFMPSNGASLVTESISVVGEGLVPQDVKIPSVPSEDYGAVTKVPFALKYLVSPQTQKIKVTYQGCEADICHLPETKEFNLATLQESNMPQSESKAGNSLCLVNALKAEGYMDADAFLQWAAGNAMQEDNILRRTFNRFGLAIVLLLLLPLGFLLNLTPCVLPMMPINLALIGAGQNVPKSERLMRGLLYGCGMTTAYGTLGIVTVLTGARFGAISASPWFNGIMCVIFVVLGLAMFGLFELDFSRYRGVGKIGGLAGVFVAGVFSAILSGACVAPVLIWALLLAATLYSEGNMFALLIPYMLGIGMALPWPLVAAGLAKLPKPGAWMMNVRRGFAVLILVFACYCGILAWRSARPGTFKGGPANYEAALAQASTQNKMLFIKFRGRVCRACDKMEQTTFQDDRVKKQLDDWICLEVDADDAANKELLAKFAIKGVPSFVLVK